MRELHVVAVSEDGRHVVLATRKGALKGEFRVPLDERLSAAVRGDLPRPGEDEPAVVTPKEIQSRLRAGESPEEIAASAGVPVSKIERYAGPVLSERERVISQARAGFVTRSRLGESALPVGEAVDRHLTETNGVRLETVSWSARREESGTWLVELSYVSQARRRGAVWRYDGARREVTALDSLAAALAHIEAGRRSRAADPEPFSAPPARTGSRPAARKAAPVRAAKAPKAPTAAKAPKTPVARTVAARPAAPPVRAAAPVPRAAAPTRAAETAASRAAAAKAAKATTARAAAQERAAQAAAAEAARAAEQAQEAADAQARAAEARAQKQAADKAAKAAKAAKDKAAKDKAAAQKAAKERAAQERADKAAADKAAKQAARDKAAAEKAAAEQAAAEQAAAEAARLEAESAAREAEQAPVGPPTLRVVGAEDAPAPARRGPKEPPAAARTAPARVAGQRASVPGWADVLLSTAPVARPEAEPDAD